MKFFKIFITFFYLSALNAGDTLQKTSWEGLYLKGYLGAAVEYLETRPPKKISLLGGPSVEYAWVFDRTFLSLDLTWLYYEDMFKSKEFTGNPLFGDYKVPSWALFLTPITGAHIGYVFESNDLVTIGFAYFWGVTGTYRHQFDDHFSIEGRATWFYDRVLYNDGLHDLHILIGINYKF